MNDVPIAIPAFSLKDASGRSLLRTPAFSLEPGSTLAVTGPSGSGKTLFLKSLFGWTDRRAVPVLTPEQGAFLMIQDPSQGLTPGLSLGGHFRDIARSRRWRPRADALLDALGLDVDGSYRRRPRSFSGGERQRLMLALILMNRPRILVCDEPAASLDIESERKLWELIREMGDPRIGDPRIGGPRIGGQREGGQRKLTLIFVTHQLGLIEEHADRVLALHRGTPLFLGPKSSFFEEPGHPRLRRLVAVHRRLNAASPVPSPETTTGKALLSVRGLSLSFGARTLFRNLDWQLEPGSWWWLTGPSGSGKTSLARAVTGLLRPDSGTVFLRDEVLPAVLADRSPAQKRAVHYIFQHGTTALNPARPMRDQLVEAYSGKTHLLDERLQTLHLAHPASGKHPADFSLGEVARLNLVMALSAEPEVVFCDEVLAPLDLVLKDVLIAFLEQYQKERGAAVVIVSHDAALEALKPAKRLVLTAPA